MIAALLLAAANPAQPVHAQPATPQPVPAPRAPTIADRTEWERAVALRVLCDQRYPPAALQQGISGKVRIRFQVDSDGQIQNAGIDQSSGSEILDQAALDTLKRIGRLPPPPAMKPAEKIVLILPVNFAMAE